MSFVGTGQTVCVFSFPFGTEGGMWDLIVVIPDPFYLLSISLFSKTTKLRLLTNLYFKISLWFINSQSTFFSFLFCNKSGFYLSTVSI